MFSNRSRRFVLLSNEYFILTPEEWGTRTREAADREGALGCLENQESDAISKLIKYTRQRKSDEEDGNGQSAGG